MKNGTASILYQILCYAAMLMVTDTGNPGINMPCLVQQTACCCAGTDGRWCGV